MTEHRPGGRRPTQAQKESRRNTKRAEIRNVSGCLTLFVDDRPCAPIVLDAANSDVASIEAAVSSGLPLAKIQLDDLCWPGPRQFDAAAVDAAIEPFLALPQAFRILLSIRVDAPLWWLEANPTERAEYARRRDPGAADVLTVSWASVRWQQGGCEALERMLKQVIKSSLGASLIGVQLLAGEAGAWIYPDAARLPDVDPCMTTAFIKYTVNKYRRNEGLLRKAWFDTRAEFSKIRCPTAIEREKAEFGLFRNPHRSRKLMDYYECLANEQSGAVLAFCSMVKRISAGSLLVGLESAPLAPETSTPECGHTYLDPILTSSDVDFFVETPTPHSANPSFGLFRPYRGSAALHGKLVFVQSTPSIGAAYSAAGDGVGAIVPAPHGAKELSDLANLASSWSKRLARPNKYQAQVALVLDPSAGLVVSHRPDAAPIQSLVLDQIALLRRAGVAFSTYSYGDMFHPQFPDHKVYLFPNCFYLSEPERRKLDARVKRSGQIAVWFWCPGIIGEDGINAEVGTKCCGQKLRLEPNDISLRTRLVDSNDPLTWGRHAGDAFGSEPPASPRCTVADGKASRLGANSDNKTSFSVRRFDTWTSVVYGTFPVPLDMLQNLFRSGTCHIYCATLKSGDTIGTDGRMLSLASRAGGTYTLSLPGQFDVLDVASGKRIGTGVSEVGLSLAADGSALFELRAR